MGFDDLIVPHPDAGGAPARPCFEIVLHYDRPRATIAEDLGRALALFVERAGGDFGWSKSNVMKRAARADADAATLVKRFVSGPAFAKPGNVGLELHSGDRAVDCRVPSLEVFSEERKDRRALLCRTFVRLCLPPEADARDLAIACAAASPPFSGHAGYSWYWDSGDTRMERELGRRRELLLDHPGASWSDPFTFYPFIGQGLTQIGWLTFLGAALRLRAGALDGLDVAPVADGIVIAAGPAPRFAGDLAPYHAVGRALAPLRLPDAAIELLDIAGLDDPAEIRAWYLRFFGE